jgi:hypothetical protein
MRIEIKQLANIIPTITTRKNISYHRCFAFSQMVDYLMGQL